MQHWLTLYTLFEYFMPFLSVFCVARIRMKLGTHFGLYGEWKHAKFQLDLNGIKKWRGNDKVFKSVYIILASTVKLQSLAFYYDMAL